VVGVVAVVMAAVVAMASACASGLVGGDGVWGLLPASTTKFTSCSVNRQYGETNVRTVGQNTSFQNLGNKIEPHLLIFDSRETSNGVIQTEL
jgi:hypothetical protein